MIEIHRDATAVVVADGGADAVAAVVVFVASFVAAVAQPFAVVAVDIVDVVAAFELALAFAAASFVTAVAVASDAFALAVHAEPFDADVAHAVVVPSFAAPALQRSLVQHWERETLAGAHCKIEKISSNQTN